MEVWPLRLLVDCMASYGLSDACHLCQGREHTYGLCKSILVREPEAFGLLVLALGGLVVAGGRGLGPGSGARAATPALVEALTGKEGARLRVGG